MSPTFAILYVVMQLKVVKVKLTACGLSASETWSYIKPVQEGHCCFFLGSTLREIACPFLSIAPSLLYCIIAVEDVLFLLKEQLSSQHCWLLLLCFNPMLPLCVGIISVVCLCRLSLLMLVSFHLQLLQMCVMHHFLMTIKF